MSDPAARQRENIREDERTIREYIRVPWKHQVTPAHDALDRLLALLKEHEDGHGQEILEAAEPPVAEVSE